jgi:CheY-like chemotaxis protein
LNWRKYEEFLITEDHMFNRKTTLSVLVVDDDKDTVSSLANVLTLYGFSCRTAHSGPDALAEVALDPPDAIVFDIRMPGMSGWTLARRVADTAYPILLIAVTGCGLEADHARTRESGAHLHFVKPVDPVVIVDTLRQFARGGDDFAADGSAALIGTA